MEEITMSDNECKEITISDNECKEILEWSRHYDNLLWIVTSLLTGANAALMAIAADKLRPEIGVFGMILTVATVFFATSFRSIRRRLHEQLEAGRPQYTYLLKGGEEWLGQWLPYVLFFAMVAILWTWMLWAKYPQHRCIWGSVLFLSLASLTYLFRKGKSGNRSAKN